MVWNGIWFGIVWLFGDCSVIRNRFIFMLKFLSKTIGLIATEVKYFQTGAEFVDQIIILQTSCFNYIRG